MSYKIHDDIVKILIVEDNTFDAFLSFSILTREPNFDIVQVGNMHDAINNLNNLKFDLVILDLNLPDSEGIESFERISEVSNVPVIVITGLNDEDSDIKLLQSGIQDYLIKGQFNKNILLKSIRYAIERAKLVNRIEYLSLTDELTNVYNRRGFFEEANKYKELSRRRNYNLLFIFIDVDNLKEINDQYGHSEGDNAISHTAGILKDSFRHSDVIGRVGGDEFAVCTIVDTYPESFEAINNRISNNIKAFNNEEKKPYQLSFSMGAVFYGQNSSEKSVEELLKEADKELYLEKMKKRINLEKEKEFEN